MRRLVFAVIMFAIAIGIVACGRTNQIQNDSNIVIASGDVVENIK